MRKYRQVRTEMKKRYGAIDGLRMIGCIGIVMMHMATNNSYEITGYIYETVIPSFTNFVFLFMMVSAFGMCCGYYEKFLNNSISFPHFYGKRFRKILPFFAVLVVLDVILSPSVDAFYEAFADLTLLFGFLPEAGNISVIGVGWFLGLIFVFYLCFPFFCVLIENKRRAWIAFGVSLVYNFVCTVYFDVGRTNILYDVCFFLAGGLAYLYREKLEKMGPLPAAIFLIVSVFAYYRIGGNTITWLMVSAALLIFALNRQGGVLDNPVTGFLGRYSLEVYLSHMAVFRMIEKAGLNTVLGNGWLQYGITILLVYCGALLVSVVIQKGIGLLTDKIREVHWKCN